MHNMKYLSLALLMVPVALFFTSCDDDDDVKAQWEIEVDEIKAATAKYLDFETAQNEGLFDASGYVPNMGHHFLNPALVDGTFELLKPEVVLYLPDDEGNMEMVAIEYSIVPADPNDPGSPPEGLTGDEDEWHFNEELGHWQLHVWTILDNPDGIFAPFNPAIGD